MTAQRTWRECYERLHKELVNAQAERSKRQTSDPGGELGWVVHERAVMHATVNRLRADLGLPAIEEERIRRAESMACGHVDYTRKFALYCADAAMQGT